MKKYIVELPDKQKFKFKTMEQAQACLYGFMGALRCFGIWKDGTQTIGCMNKPIEDIENDLFIQVEEDFL